MDRTILLGFIPFIPNRHPHTYFGQVRGPKTNLQCEVNTRFTLKSTVGKQRVRKGNTCKMAVSNDENSLSEQQKRFSLHGKVAVVTGGHRGIGEAISIGLSNAGADVIILDRDGPRSSVVPEYVKKINRRYGWSRCDLSSIESIEESTKEIKKVLKEWNGKDKQHVDIIVNNAGVALLEPLSSMSTWKTWDSTYDINVRAPMYLSQLLLSTDKEHQQCIVNISSAAASRALDLHGAYCSSKSALEMLTKCMAVEWSCQHNVRINAVAPTVVLTDMGKRVWEGTEKGDDMLKRVSMGRFAEPHEVADVVVFMCSDAAKMINGAVIPVDGGFTAT